MMGTLLGAAGGAFQQLWTPIQTALQPFWPLLSAVLPWGIGAIALYAIWKGIAWLLRSSHRSRPAVNKAPLAELQPLQQQGWKFELGSSAETGDRQIIARSPQGKAYCIIVKAERGRIGSDGRTVFRLYDQSRQPFSSDFILQTKQRTARTQQRLHLRTAVVPVLAFAEAVVAVEPSLVAGVHVVSVADLRRTLLTLG